MALPSSAFTGRSPCPWCGPRWQCWRCWHSWAPGMISSGPWWCCAAANCRRLPVVMAGMVKPLSHGIWRRHGGVAAFDLADTAALPRLAEAVRAGADRRRGQVLKRSKQSYSFSNEPPQKTSLVDTRAAQQPLTQNTLHPAAISSPSLMPRGGGRGVGLAARNVNRDDLSDRPLNEDCVFRPIWRVAPGSSAKVAAPRRLRYALLIPHSMMEPGPRHAQNTYRRTDQLLPRHEVGSKSKTWCRRAALSWRAKSAPIGSTARCEPGSIKACSKTISPILTLSIG